MTFPRTASRIAAAACAVGIAIGALSACAPEPTPTPTPTAAFASEEEAFAAAEEVYQEYTEAGNAGADVSQYLTGTALEGQIDTMRYLDENDLQIVGASNILSSDPIVADLASNPASVQLAICLDVSESRVRNAEDEDVTPTDRADTWALTVTFVALDDGLLISDSIAGETSCSG